MEVYQWLLRKLGFEVQDTGYFLYANGQDAGGFDERLKFDVSLLPYTGNSDWVEPTVFNLKKCLMGRKSPKAPEDCEFCGYIDAVKRLAG
jgi:hypothetical protein